MPCAVESLREMVPDLPFVLVERVMPPRDADALLEDLRAEATTWGQDEWWIAGEARKAPRLTAVYEMPPLDDARAEALQWRASTTTTTTRRMEAGPSACPRRECASPPSAHPPRSPPRSAPSRRDTFRMT